MKLNKVKVDIPIFNHSVTLVQCSFDTILTYLSVVHNENMSHLSNLGKANAICFIAKGKIYIWWNKKVTIPILVHEIAHATFEIMNQRGLLVTDEEAFCYLQEYILKEVLCIMHEPMGHSNLQLEQEDIRQ